MLRITGPQRNRIQSILSKALGDEEIIGKSGRRIKQARPEESKYSLKSFVRDDRMFVKDKKTIRTDKKRPERLSKRNIDEKPRQPLILSPVLKKVTIETSPKTTWVDDLDSGEKLVLKPDSWPNELHISSFIR
jgi:hypothetical protein